MTAPLIVTAGEPAGIGPELCLALANQPELPPLVVAGDPQLLRERAAGTGLDISIVETDWDHPQPAGANALAIAPVPFAAPVTAGKLNTGNAPALLDGLRLAVAGCQDGRFAGLVTAPLQKSVINDAGIPFSGHTEFLAELTDTERPVMLLVAGDLRVALATTHLPLRAVPDALSIKGIEQVASVLHAGLQQRFGLEDPRIVVCGLNPHAGEGGHLGHEDAEIIAPAIERLRTRGWRIDGPMPADTAFTPAAGACDAILAMYHDQGLPVLKYAGFGNAVNVTLGLPIVRTSVDHGTALDLAGSGRADPGSLVAAVRLAGRMTLS